MSSSAPQCDEDPAAARPLRADAARNREVILDTARRLFAERGISVTLNDIAHEASVGVGTVYRKFPDKNAVIEALLAAKFTALHDIAARAAAESNPEQALRSYLIGVFEYRAKDRALSDAIIRVGGEKPAIVASRERLEREVTAIVERAREAGCLREGFSARDIPLLVPMVGVIADQTRQCGNDLWRRYAALVIDGVLDSEESEPLPGQALPWDQLARSLHPA